MADNLIATDEPAESVVMPRPTVAPMVLAMGMALLAAGIAWSVAFVVVGAVVLVFGLGLWISDLLPGRGHFHEPLVEPSARPQPVIIKTGAVGHMQEGMPGYRLRLPTEVHPISAGVKGGIIGGVLMPLPALLWGLLSGHGIWYPVNLLAGLVLPGVGRMTDGELEQFRLSLLLVGVVIHAINSVTFGLIYGVLLPTLPSLPKPIAWGGLVIPMLWTALSFGLMGVVNPLLNKRVDWPSFIAAQFVFGVVAAIVIDRLKSHEVRRAGLIGGAIGGLAMAVPAEIWTLSSGRGLWYPANLLAAMILPGMDRLSASELESFRPGWLAIALTLHVGLSLSFGVVFGLLLTRVRPIPSTLAWGGFLMPLLWTSFSFGLMGVVNPLLQKRVDWPWFVASQFVFGVVAAVVVARSEKQYISAVGSRSANPGASAAGPVGGDT
jgi:uncharacterized membrane protein YagU involved in acid resistance